ncbi:MAG: hypothetical protein IT175_06660 [Acidobacteria bacterium]|nr:hypothetical protein [Acidobacteriota bacterium]
MNVHKQQRSTFRDTVARLADRNADALMRRARRANRIAKSAVYHARANAYLAKSLALEALALRFADRTTVEVDPYLPAYVLVRVEDARFALHAPASRFRPGT